MSDLKTFGQPLPPLEPASALPDWRQCDPDWIESALARAQTKPGGGWLVLDASERVGTRPRRYRAAGVDWVAWRTREGVVVAPDACPHMGASLADGCIRDGNIVCPWHGLRLGARGHADWQPVPALDDGHLVWAQILAAEAPADAPLLSGRPTRALDAIIQHEVQCEPADVIANRLDPWHGAHLHPYSFARLRVLEQLDDEVTVRVVYRVAGRFGVEVDARFYCTDLRTIVMSIVRGEGEGSIVETHATPIAPGLTMVTELTLATSAQRHFWTVVNPLAPLLRPLVRRAATRLWKDDAAYAERRYRMRTGRRLER